MDFSLTTLFVVPSGNTIPTTGSTQDLAASQLGIFDNAYAPVTAGNAASKPYIYIAQGRNVTVEGLGSKRSDRIYAKNILPGGWYKVVAEPQIPSQITELSGFNVKCEEDLTITFRLMSSYINVSYYNGLTKSIWVKAPCCDCGGDPCETVDATGVQTIVDEFATKINSDAQLSRFLTAIRIGTGATSILRVYAKLLDKYGNPCDPTAYSFEYDRLSFWTYAHKGPINTQDLETYDACDTFVDSITITQRAMYGRGSSAEIAQLEKNFYSYQTTFKHIFEQTGFNGAFQSEVVDGTFYDTYYLRFQESTNDNYSDVSGQDATVIIAVPTGTGSGLEAILVAFAGAVTDMSATDRTTTTTTSTSSTTTTSTTFNIFP